MSTTSSHLAMSRRAWLDSATCGFGALALQNMICQSAMAGTGSLRASGAHQQPRAKRVIFLFMAGGPSQSDLFDPKPYISERHGETIDAPVNDQQIRVGVDQFIAMGPVAPVRPRGQCGMTISDLLPNLGSVADELCLLQALHTDNKAHAPATLQFHTGTLSDVRPSMGSWISYGLGSENNNLPGFITIHPPGDGRTYGSSFLPASHQGTPLRVPENSKASAIPHLNDPDTTPSSQRKRLDFLQDLNQNLLNRVEQDSQMTGIMESFELAFRMQMETPKLVDLSSESQSTRDLYGIDQEKTDRNGRACLLARRLSEAGVRFVQVTVGGWDHHGDIKTALPNSCAGIDKPIAGLLKDLRQRGLLEDTLVVWSGEFGRSQWSQDISGTSPLEKHGREHQQESFCAWLAGGGVKGGLTYGMTDDFGYHPVEDSMHLYDLHATILHLLGLDHERLTYRHAGRDFRLTDIFGKVIEPILS